MSPLLLNIAASHSAVSAALVQERCKDSKPQQYPVYFVSEVLTNSKCNMTELEKIAYTVLMASHKLRHYFEAYKIRIPIDRGLSDLFRNLEASVRIAKWAAELSSYNITFEPRTAIRSQVLDDFIVDWIGSSVSNHQSLEIFWTIHCDGAWCQVGAGAATVITSPTGAKYRYAACLSFALKSDKCTNNIAEYEAIILGLQKLRALEVTTCIVKIDSKIVTRQIEKDCSAKELVLMQYLLVVQSLEKQFKWFTLQHIERSKNEEADMISKAAAKGDPIPSDVFFHTISTTTVRNLKVLQIIDDPEGRRIVNLIMIEDWRASITLYLQGHYHPTNQAEAKRLKHRSCDFAVIEGQLYKNRISQPLLKCIIVVEGIKLLREVHKSICGSHSGPRALASKVMR
jgi:ribonuclease HI